MIRSVSLHNALVLHLGRMLELVAKDRPKELKLQEIGNQTLPAGCTRVAHDTQLFFNRV